MPRRIISVIALLSAIFSITCAPQDPIPPPKSKPIAAENSPPIPEPMKARIDAALEEVHSRDLRIENGFWTVFHGILGMGPETTLYDPESKKKLNALDEIFAGRKLRGLEFKVRSDGSLDVTTGVGSGTFQGHQDQFIAEMTQWGTPRDRPVMVEGRRFTFEDFVKNSRAEASVTRQQELSWAIVIISEFFGTDHRWKNRFDETLALEDVARYELGQPIDTAACGGTHRLFGLTWAYYRHREKGGKTEGVWKDVGDRIDFYKRLAFDLQNKDGSFASSYLAKPGLSPVLSIRLSSTGHVFEWLALALRDDELRDPRMELAASALALMILENRNGELDGGALYHATHGLHIYRTRRFGTPGPHGLTIPTAPKL